MSRTARSMPTSDARDTMLWPMFSSTISGIAAIGMHVDVVEAVAGQDLDAFGGAGARRLDESASSSSAAAAAPDASA